MKDIMSKLAELEATAPKTTKKKMLKEDATTPPMNVSDKPASLKDLFETMAAGQKPIPVVGKEGSNQQTGAGFLNVTDPALQGLGKALGDLAAQKKIQMVVPTQPGQQPAGQQQQQQQGQPNQAGATGQPQQGQMQMKEKDEGKPGKNFAKIAKKAGAKYGSKEAGERVAGAVRAKLAKQGKLEEEQLDELSPKTLRSYTKKADIDQAVTNRELKNRYHTGLDPDLMKQSNNRTKGMKLAGDKMMGRAKVPANEGAKVDRMVKHIEKSERKLGKSKEKASDIAWATANKRGMLDNKNKKKKANEGEIPSTQGIDTKGAGLGAGRSDEVLEGKKKGYDAEWAAADAENDLDSFLSGGHDVPKKYRRSHPDKNKGTGRSQTTLESKKPDFLDLDKDGNKKEPMKKAAADKKKKKVDESMNHRINAARLEGKSHGLRGHAHCGKSYDDREEMKAYHEGYVEGLDECYGMGVYEEAMPATVPGMASGAMPSMPAMEAEFDEGNAFTAALAKTPKGGKFSVGGKTFTDNSSLEEYAFESLDKQLNDLLNEGLSVSVSKGQQNAPDSVTITAQDAEADQLLQLVKHAGLGLFGDEHVEPSQAMSVQPAHGEPDEVGAGGVDLEVVDGSDDMLSLMQKLGGVEASGHDEDYADEEGHDEFHAYGDEEGEEETNEASCNECGMMEAGCQCDKEPVEEEETEDQMEFEVAEDNAPDSGAQDSVADEDAEAGEDAALAGADSGDEEEMNESFFNLLKKFSTISESKDEEDEEDVTESKDDDDEDYDPEEDGPDHGKAWSDTSDELKEEQLDELSPGLAHRAASAASTAAAAGAVPKDHKLRQQAKKFATYSSNKRAEEEEGLNEWANQAGKGPGKGTDASFEQDIEFMTKVIAGGLNKPKSTGQTTVPVIANQDERTHDNPKDWAALAGIKK